MKYDRPVWQIMHECADAMPTVFRYDDVRTWFAQEFPDVNEATIRAHLIGLTEGGRAKHVQFAPRSPVFRRVARGEYEAIPVAERGEDPNVPVPSTSQIKMSGNGHHRVPAGSDGAFDQLDGDDEEQDEEPLVPDIILIGSIGDRVNVPAPAKEVFREVDFQLSRLDAELSDSEWFVLSAEHGLVEPNEWISPDSRTLADMDPEYRSVWASWVVARLTSIVGSLDGMIVRVDAPNHFTGPLFTDLQDAGAVVSSGTITMSTKPDAGADESGAFRRPDPAEIAARRATERATVQEVDTKVHTKVDTDDTDDELATVTEIETASPAGLHLADSRQAVPAVEAESLPQQPGIYGWIVDPIGARVLNRCLRLPVAAGLVFVGQVGASSWHSLVDPVLNIRDHVDRVQLHGRTRASTFRMTLATVLSQYLGLTSLDDPRLTEWMLMHLSVTTWPVDDGEGLRELTQILISELDPPLNVDHLPASEYRDRLQEMRGALA